MDTCIHCNNKFDFFCTCCQLTFCKDCDVASCYQNKHYVITMNTAVNRFKKELDEVKKLTDDIKLKIEEKRDSIMNDNNNFQRHKTACKTDIDCLKNKVIKEVEDKCKKLISDLDNLSEERDKVFPNKVDFFDSVMEDVDRLNLSITKLCNPRDLNRLERFEKDLSLTRNKVIDDDQRSLMPKFIQSKRMNDMISCNIIGEIIAYDPDYEVVTCTTNKLVQTGESFTIDVLSSRLNQACQVVANLTKSTGERSNVEVIHVSENMYKIKSLCNSEGDWKMKITVDNRNIKGSPIDIVVVLRLVCTIDNISNNMGKKNTKRVVDVMSLQDGSILISNGSCEVLKFNQSGSFVDSIDSSQNVCNMCKLDDNHIVYSNHVNGPCIVLCNDQFKEIRSFGKDKLAYPSGVTVNKPTRVVYVTDDQHGVLKFSVDNGEYLGRIGRTIIKSEDKRPEDEEMNGPLDVALNHDNQLLVADTQNSRVQIFDTNGEFVSIAICAGQEDGKVICPCGIIVDEVGNIIVSSNNMLQLFNKNGVFIKRIDHKEDG
ncbi:uncharacterized protein [Antedon mediterranea]|uniref:uncharacterized protein n=1 Tax=Antedon mediterranea TaxID=105859 RepID=UPI003AF76DAB